MHVAHPWRPDSRGRTMQATDDRYLSELIEQVLLTSPGERLNRPTFGCGLAARVFDVNGPDIAAMTETTVRAALLQWLSDLILVDDVSVHAHEGQLVVRVVYRPVGSDERRTVRIDTTVPGGGQP